jgi:hypothetical protein
LPDVVTTSAATPATPAATTAQTHQAECDSGRAGAGVSLMGVLAGTSTIEGLDGAGSLASARRGFGDRDSARATAANKKTGKTSERSVNLGNLMQAS